MTAEWRECWTTPGWRRAGYIDTQLGAGMSLNGTFTWIARRGWLTLGSGAAPTLRAAQLAAEHFAKRMEGVRV